MTMEFQKKLKIMAEKSHFNGQFYSSDNENSFEISMGIEHMKRKTVISLKTAFPIASGTKFLTALAIGMLIEQKMISLDTYVKDILTKDVYWYGNDVQIKHLLSHTSGLPDYLDESSSQNEAIDNIKLLTIKDYLQYFPKKAMEFKPGTQFKYHNGAFVYLALIIENLTQVSYQTFINDFLLLPLGIQESGIFLTSAHKEHKAEGYMDKDKKITHLGYIPEMAGGDGGAYMRALDFQTLIKAFINQKILGARLTKAFMTPQIIVNDADDLYYGFGLWLKKCGNTYIPYVNGVDQGIYFKSIFSTNMKHFYWIATNTNNDVKAMVDYIDQRAFK